MTCLICRDAEATNHWEFNFDDGSPRQAIYLCSSCANSFQDTEIFVLIAPDGVRRYLQFQGNELILIETQGPMTVNVETG